MFVGTQARLGSLAQVSQGDIAAALLRQAPAGLCRVTRIDLLDRVEVLLVVVGGGHPGDLSTVVHTGAGPVQVEVEVGHAAKCSTLWPLTTRHVQVVRRARGYLQIVFV